MELKKRSRNNKIFNSIMNKGFLSHKIYEIDYEISNVKKVTKLTIKALNHINKVITRGDKYIITLQNKKKQLIKNLKKCEQKEIKHGNK